MDNADEITRGVSEKLGIEDVDPIEVIVPEVTINKEDPTQDIINDYEYIRSNSIKSIASCDAILEHVLKTMTIEVSPRHVESCASIIDTQMKCAKGLIEIHEKLRKLRVKPSPGDADGNPPQLDENGNPIISGDNVIVMGSVKDVMKMVNGSIAENEEIIDNE